MIILQVMMLTLALSCSSVQAMKDSLGDLKTVSYIYYPYWGDVGHAELEVDGQCWTLKKGERKVRSLKERINKRKRKKTEALDFPFYRYVITVTPQEFQQLKKHVGKSSFYSLICSMGALYELSEHAHFNVPIPFRISPLISSCYLSGAKDLGSKRIKDIEFYGNKKSQHLIAKGMTCECWGITLVTISLAMTVYFIVVNVVM